MNKLEIGQFVRLKSGYSDESGIGKLSFVAKCGVAAIDFKNENLGVFVEDIKKASFNIIDVIKPKDIILGKDGKLYQCWKIYKDYVFTYSKNKYGDTITLVDYQIDRILTKEQFESMSYRIGG